MSKNSDVEKQWETLKEENEKLWEFIKAIKEYINKAIPFYASGGEVDEKALYELQKLRELITACEPK